MDSRPKAGRQPAYYYGWNIVGLTVLAQMAAYGIAINCLSLYLPLWSQDLNAPVSLLAFCYTAPAAVFCLLGPLTGYCADRFSIRIMLALGLAGAAVSFALASQVTHAWQLIAIFATIAPASMVVSGFVPCQTLISRWFERRRGMAIGLCALGQSLAGALLPPVLAVALPAIGWRQLFLFVAAFLAVVCVPLALLVVRDRPRQGEGQGLEFTREHVAPVATAAAMNVKQILTRSNFWILVTCYVSAGLISSGFLVNLAPMVASENLESTDAAALLSILSITALGTKLLAGYALDRVGPRAVLIAILAMGTGGMVVLLLVPGFAGLLTATFLIAGCLAIIVPMVATAGREFGPAVVGRVMGLLAAVGVIGVTGPPLMAYMRETTGGYDAPLMMLAVLGVVSIFIASRLKFQAASVSAVPAVSGAPTG